MYAFSYHFVYDIYFFDFALKYGSPCYFKPIFILRISMPNHTFILFSLGYNTYYGLCLLVYILCIYDMCKFIHSSEKA